MAYQFTQTGAEIQDILDQVPVNTSDISALTTATTPQTISVTIGTSSSIGASTNINVYRIGRLVVFSGSAYVSNLSANTSLALASGFPAPMTSFVYTGSGGYSASVPTAYYINSAGNMTFRSHTAITTEQEFYISGVYVTAS